MTTVGGYIEHARLGRCRIIAEHGTGTYDLEALDGRCYRITGVRMVPIAALGVLQKSAEAAAAMLARKGRAR